MAEVSAVESPGAPAPIEQRMLPEQAAAQRSGPDALGGGADRDDAGRIICAYALWLCFGFVFGLHWLWIAVMSAPGWMPLSRPRPAAIAHALAYWLCAALFVFFRQTMLPWKVDCPGGETMSTDCLWHTQPAKYAAFYTLHLFLLVWGFVKFFYDAGALWRWVAQSAAGGSRSVCCCASVQFSDLWVLLICGVVSGVIILGWALSDWSVG
eukprot:TRINITY_DN70629_c0_g1_i1.p1 TRINITY_DN70629_c0_g1~~TRINITY_DN70629_c0_g1_i1.p1  ORF type:complete len:210 (+),score=37.33 TRINITY_DN70629_c0_g1_i1:75-704(+)